MIRPATQSDAATIAALHRASILCLCAGAYSGEQLAAWIAALPGRYEPLIAGAVVLVAEEDGNLVGFGVCSPQQGLVNAAYVAPDAKERGVGRRLVAAMETVLREVLS